eukprot:jgi/Tetstr1/434634/TSEL_023725.t1
MPRISATTGRRTVNTGRRASCKTSKLRKEMGQFRPDSGTAVLPERRVLVKRVEQIVRARSADDARKSKDGSMWQGRLPQLCAEDALQNKQWSELREYLFLVG